MLADGVATVGITNHAVDQLGDLVFVELPQVGTKLAKGDVAATVESVKAASEVYCPLDGEIVAVNEAIVNDPSTVNSDPQAGGWFFKLKLARARRYSGAIGARCKLIGGYIDNLAALAEARASGADEAIMLNERGDVACASAANVFLISAAGEAATPRLSDGALPGVVRGILIAGAHDVRIEERSICAEELSTALVLLTNSLRGVVACAGGSASPRQAIAAAALKSCYAEALAAEPGRENA